MNLTTLKGIIEGATEGPWELRRITVNAINGATIFSANGIRIGNISHKADKATNQKEADAQLIILSRTALPRAIGLIEEAEKSLRDAETALGIILKTFPAPTGVAVQIQCQQALAQIESFKANVGGSDED